MIEILILTFVVLSVICLWILIERRKSPKFLVWFIPVLLVLTSSTYWTYTTILGNPKVGMPEEGMYVSHYIDEPLWIYLWIVHKNNVPVSYQIPYNRKTHEKIEGVEGKTDEGRTMMVKPIFGDASEEKPVGDRSRAGFTVGGDISFYEWNYKTGMPVKN